VGRLDRREVATMKDITIALCWLLATLGGAALLRWLDKD
jgi:hypothetical protein